MVVDIVLVVDVFVVRNVVIDDIGIVISLFKFAGVIIVCGLVFGHIVVDDIVPGDTIVVVGNFLFKTTDCCSLYLRLRNLRF